MKFDIWGSWSIEYSKITNNKPIRWVTNVKNSKHTIPSSKFTNLITHKDHNQLHVTIRMMHVPWTSKVLPPWSLRHVDDLKIDNQLLELEVANAMWHAQQLFNYSSPLLKLKIWIPRIEILYTFARHFDMYSLQLLACQGIDEEIQM
jgi:hypothetical protein